MVNSKQTNHISVAILGSVGVPAKYGGFETLAENLVHYHRDHVPNVELTVYCSSVAYKKRPKQYENAKLRYIPLNANGKSAMFYDMWSLVDAVIRGVDVVILLGHGGSFVIPLLKLITKTKFIVNIDGIEWKREKWSSLARKVIRTTESFAIKYSHVVVADNEAIRNYVDDEFGRDCEVIPYGGDHAFDTTPDYTATAKLPEKYALALCRIEPENNVRMILEAYAKLDTPLVFVGNWANSEYGRDLKTRFSHLQNIIIHDPVYDGRCLRAIRDRATLYIHGHSAGGTNPALVEMMHFSIPILAHGCTFNRYSTEEKARYFMSARELVELIKKLSNEDGAKIGSDMREIADRRYIWNEIGHAYFKLLED